MNFHINESNKLTDKWKIKQKKRMQQNIFLLKQIPDTQQSINHFDDNENEIASSTTAQSSSAAARQ